MRHLITSIKETKLAALVSTESTRITARFVLNLPVEWKLLFALLALMALRLVTIVSFVLKHS